MFASDIWVFKKMDVRCFLFRMLLFQTLVAWCGAKHVTINFNSPADVEEAEVHESIRNLIHTGIYSHKHLDPSQVQITHPVKVTAEGTLVSRSVEHAHAHGHARARRDLHDVEQDLPHSLHYNLTVDGRDLRLDLRPSVTFITPAMIVERHRASGRSRSRPSDGATSCHYTGSVRGQPGSVVALSACDGLAGHLRTANGEYWIEPSNQLPTDGTEGRPHVIFRRSAVDKVEAFHRAKRAVPNRNNRNNGYQNNNRNQNMRRGNDNRRSKMDIDKRRREFLERRRKRLEAMRRNPVEYRRHQANLRMEERRSHSSSKSSSIETSKSLEQFIERKNRQSLIDQDTEKRMRRIRNRRQRKRRNCATKQPPYQWRKRNSEERREENAYRNKNTRQQYNPNYAGAKRSARSVSKPRHVEVLLVADKSMTDFHNQGNLETYLLTIMNMVSSLYMDPSIGNYIKIVVVKIIELEEIDAARELHVSTNADSTLASFCKWQQGHNPGDDGNPHHHDVAILVTRQDICSQHNSACSTLGVAHVAGMCKPDRSCSVNEDNGIMLAHTITHELGHNFGLYHDTEKIGCHRRDGDTLHIMTPIFEADTVQMAWSRCSKRDVTNFLDAGLGECLSDRPSKEEYYDYPEDPPGVLYDAESQCRLMFGKEDATVCAKPSEICETLWCLVSDNSRHSCQTMIRPAAPGTTCGQNMWCQNQTCVEKSPSPSPVDGGWSDWSEWSECSRTCGAGASTQSRECNNPAPNYNGAYCIGNRSRNRVCNTDPCPINEPTFREVQCSKHNNMSYKNETITEWIPYFDQDKPCELQCIAKETDLEMLNGFVADGTPCKQSLGARDMCIAGICYKVGCDWVVDSDAKEDACGVCGGDGSACKTVLGSYSKDTTKQSGLDEVATIPAGSRNVKIQEKVSPGNYISIGSARSRKLYLSGARNSTTTAYLVAGAQAIYERDRDWEKVMIPGPLSEDIKVYQRLYHGRKHRNPGVIYQYTVDAKRLKNQYHYRLSEWSSCNATCGVGYMTRHMECVDRNNRVMEQSKCYNIEFPRQVALMQQCQNQACHTSPPRSRPTPPTRPPQTRPPLPQTRPQPSQPRTPHPQTRPPTPQTRSLIPHTRPQNPQSRALPFQTRLTPQSRPTSVYARPLSENTQLQTHQTRPPIHQTRPPTYQTRPPTHQTTPLTHQTRPPPDHPRTIQTDTHWWTGNWNPCSKHCRMPGLEPTKQRNIYCVNKITNKVVEDSHCDLETKPISIIKCADLPAC